eukprot:TRINITY_DN246_c5_g2_i2.p1 TRINITY_DN246_c5_g2~~TRINITY_DN246_c5_g2_i2.p1  ORF type:complete len:231 (+),score=30.30 TRINITY_DN246_c5_g2_i2:43-693(+)
MMNTTGRKKMSSRLDPTGGFTDPFGSKKSKCKTAFSQEHSAGGIPVHIGHTGNTMKLVWDCKPEEVDEGRLIVLSAQGLKECAHPSVFLAPAVFESLLQRPGIGERTVVPLLDRIVPPIRESLYEPNCLAKGIQAVRLVSSAAGPHLNKYLPNILQGVARHLSNKVHRETIESLLISLEENGGPEASKIIKAKIPTYTTIHRVSSSKPVGVRPAFT